MCGQEEKEEGESGSFQNLLLCFLRTFSAFLSNAALTLLTAACFRLGTNLYAVMGLAKDIIYRPCNVLSFGSYTESSCSGNECN